MIDVPDHVPDYTRLKVFYGAFLILFAAIIARLWFLQIVKGPELLAESEQVRTRLIRRVAPRGTIVDVRDRVLASSRPHFVIAVLPDELNKHPEVIPRLAGLLGLSTPDLTTRIQHNKLAPFDPVPVSDDVQIELLSRIEEHQPDLPGVLIVKDPKRDYAYGRLFAHVIGIARPINADQLKRLQPQGYRPGDIVGQDGLEKTYEDDLRGTDGGQRIEVNARGRIRNTLEEVKPVPGRTLKLTLDLDLQRVAYGCLNDQLAAGHPGAVVAMDPRDGAVMAFVSMPSFNPNTLGPEYDTLKQDPDKPMVNRVSDSAYPNGSTFKLITAAAGLETGVLTPTSTDYCPGFLRVGTRTFHCDKRSGHGQIDILRAIGASCDVFFWKVGRRVGQRNLAAYCRKFGLGSRTGIDLPVDRKGIVPTPAWKRKYHRGAWVLGDLINMSIGQGDVAVTPLQLVDYTAGLANGGTLYRPQLVREVVDNSSGHAVSVHRLAPEVRGDMGISPTTRQVIVEGMERAMERGGTAAASAVPGLAVAGKTGSAQVYIHGHKATHSLFTCFAPVDHPQIALTVMVEGAGDGADAAAPIARTILTRYFHLDRQVASATVSRPHRYHRWRRRG
jgi:penicillin-binding protein 2